MNNLFLVSLFCSISILTMGQDTTYLDFDKEKVESLEEATYYKIVTHDPDDKNRASAKYYFTSGQIESEINYSNYKDRILDGKLKEWNEKGQLLEEIDYKNGKIDGMILTYWENGKPKRIDKMKDNVLVEGLCLNIDGVETTHTDYYKMAEFPGGLDALIQYMVKETNYPKRARKKGITGKVLVSFIVNKDGSISNARVVEKVDDELDAEALRVVNNMPRWSPGSQDGDPVRMVFNLPVKFTLK